MEVKAIQTVEVELMDELKSSMFCMYLLHKLNSDQCRFSSKSHKETLSSVHNLERRRGQASLPSCWCWSDGYYVVCCRGENSRKSRYTINVASGFEVSLRSHIGITWLTFFPGPNLSLGIIHLRSRGSYRSVCNAKKRWGLHLDKPSLYFSAKSLRTTTSI